MRQRPETLILDCLLSDASLFTRADEVEAAWAHLPIESVRSGPTTSNRSPKRPGPGSAAAGR
jgi:glucose-6-phosphate 1-dehydrogenase